MKLSGELDYRIRYDVEHDLFHAQNVFSDEYITPTFVEYVQNLEKENVELKEQVEKMKCTLKKIIKTVQNDNISGYGDRLVKIYDISCEVLQELEK